MLKKNKLNDEIKLQDELTLDNLSMSQLRALCRLLNVPVSLIRLLYNLHASIVSFRRSFWICIFQPLGSPEILRFQLNMKLRELKADDKVSFISISSISNLSLYHSKSQLKEEWMHWLLSIYNKHAEREEWELLDWVNRGWRNKWG